MNETNETTKTLTKWLKLNRMTETVIEQLSEWMRPRMTETITITETANGMIGTVAPTELMHTDPIKTN
jgi:hypothetical protein